MQQYKYISFENVADLERKLAKMREIRDKNLQETEEFLVSTGIPFIKTEEGFGVALGDLENERIEAYFSKFDTQSRTTREQFTSLGVVYIDKPDQHLDQKLDLQSRRN